MSATREFGAARDLLLELRADYEQAHARFAWPCPVRFNWAVDWFGHLVDVAPQHPALLAVGQSGAWATITVAQLGALSDQTATWWHRMGVRRGDVVLLVFDNVPALWAAMLAAMKLGAVAICASPRLSRADFADRLQRGAMAHVMCDAPTAGVLGDLLSGQTRLCVCADGEPLPSGWHSFAASGCAPGESDFPVASTKLSDPMLGYFTSGTTSHPKLVIHSHGYPIGCLSTMYWTGLTPGDVHLNIAAPGWAKHLASGLFAAFNAQATSVLLRQPRFSAAATLATIEQLGVTTMCAPPTAWRMLAEENLAGRASSLREAVSAGESLGFGIVERLARELGVTVRNGYGQTETAHVLGDSPGQHAAPGSMGRPMPGFEIRVANPGPGGVGELEVGVPRGRVGIMAGVQDAWHRTGDLAIRDVQGCVHFVGRVDDVFKTSGYRVSPLEIERALLEHPAVAEVAVVPSPDPVRAWVPKAYVSLAMGWNPDRDTAASIMQHARCALAPYKHIRRLTFCQLPKTISGKIRRSEVRKWESDRQRASHFAVGQTGREWHDHEFVNA